MNEHSVRFIKIYNALKKERWKQRREYFSQIAGSGATLLQSAENLQYNSSQLYNTNWGGKGHGIAAEEANTMIDRLSGKKAEIVGRDNAKNGADRIVGTKEIQTKYYKTALRSVNSGFDHKGDGMYRYFDKHGKPMPLEVPKDQYNQAIVHMRKKIAEGKVPGVSNPNQAKNLIRKGNITYKESLNITKFGTKESICFDVVQGAKLGAVAGGIAAGVSVVQDVVKGSDGKTTAKNALKVGSKSAIQATATSVIANQAMRSAICRNINKNVPVACAATVVLTAEDVYKSFVGEQSFKQTGKNFIKNGSGVGGGMAGAMCGAALGSVIPVVGTFVGGLVGGVIGGIAASAVADTVMTEWLGIKDDVDEMLENLNQKSAQLQEDYWFSEDEREILSEVLQHGNLGDVTKSFIKEEDKHSFCQDLIEPLMLTIMEDREAKMIISPKEFYEGFKNVKLG